MSHSHSATPNPNFEPDDMVTSLAAHAGVSRDRIELIVYRRLARSLTDRIELGADRGLDALMAAALSETQQEAEQ